jgi:hypothetical protein
MERESAHLSVTNWGTMLDQHVIRVSNISPMRKLRLPITMPHGRRQYSDQKRRVVPYLATPATSCQSVGNPATSTVSMIVTQVISHRTSRKA